MSQAEITLRIRQKTELEHEVEAAGVLLAMRHAQSVAIGERDPLVDAILAHGEDILIDGQWYGTPSEMVRELSDARADIPHLGGAKRIARMLREAQPTLDLMGWTIRWNLRDTPRGTR